MSDGIGTPRNTDLLRVQAFTPQARWASIG